MSENLAAAAAALNAPEELVRKSAEAKAKALGGSAEDYLAAWGGGAPAPAPAAAPPPAVEAPTEPEPAEAAPAPVPAPQPAAPPPPPPEAPVVERATIPSAPPILEGRRENPLVVTAAAVGVVLVALFLSFVAPSVPEAGNGVYSSAVPLSTDGRDGRSLYRSEGCAACHTQMVRPLVLDAGLGGVTISDTNQVIGTRRFGPDLAHVGSRLEPGEIRSVLTGSSEHPSYASLGERDLDRLVAYMVESK